MSHANAQLTPAGRLRLARLVVDQGWPLRRAAERWNCSVTTAQRWADRYRLQGRAGMADRSSRPHHCAHQTPTRRERRVIGMRVSRRWGPARIAYRLGMAPSTVHKILRRYGCPPLTWTDPATGVRTKWTRRKVHHYVHDAPGDMVHVDIKKLGRIPDGGGHKVLGRALGKRDRRRAMGYWYIHNAVDDHSRPAYSELLEDERKETRREAAGGLVVDGHVGAPSGARRAVQSRTPPWLIFFRRALDLAPGDPWSPPMKRNGMRVGGVWLTRGAPGATWLTGGVIATMPSITDRHRKSAGTRCARK